MNTGASTIDLESRAAGWVGKTIAPFVDRDAGEPGEMIAEIFAERRRRDFLLKLLRRKPA